MKVLIQTLGSAGDTHPFLALGRTLVERGHEVVVFANEVFETEVNESGLRFVAMGGAESYNDLANNPEVWDTRRGIEKIFRAVADHLDEAVTIIEEELDGTDVLVASSLGWGSRLVRDIHGIPLVMAHLAPALFRSNVRLPRTEVMWVRDSFPDVVKELWWRVGDFLVDRIVGPELNRVRRRRGLDPVHRIMKAWGVYSPDVTLGLFPDWFGPPQPDWHQPVRLTGFPLFEAEADTPDPGLESWLEKGDPPVVFTAGSANRHAASYFAAAVEVAGRLGVRAILVTANDADVPSGLPPDIKHVSFAPFGWLFGKSRALVSNGGIGTCAQALAAGIPHLVVHVNFDQRDNGSRVSELGAGSSMPARRFTGATGYEAMRSLLAGRAGRRARELSTLVDPSAARAMACDAIEEAGS